MGKVGGVLTGVRHASHEVAVIADDDVRWTPEQLARTARRLDGAAVVRTAEPLRPGPGTRHVGHRPRSSSPEPPEATGRARSSSTRPRSLRAGGYDGEALFENLELVRTLEATGGTELVALDLVVRRLPPTTRQFLSQRSGRPTTSGPGRGASSRGWRSSPCSSSRGPRPSLRSSWARSRWPRSDDGVQAERSFWAQRGPLDPGLGARAIDHELAGGDRPCAGRSPLRHRPSPWAAAPATLRRLSGGSRRPGQQG